MRRLRGNREDLNDDEDGAREGQRSRRNEADLNDGWSS